MTPSERFRARRGQARPLAGSAPPLCRVAQRSHLGQGTHAVHGRRSFVSAARIARERRADRCDDLHVELSGHGRGLRAGLVVPERVLEDLEDLRRAGRVGQASPSAVSILCALATLTRPCVSPTSTRSPDWPAARATCAPFVAEVVRDPPASTQDLARAAAARRGLAGALDGEFGERTRVAVRASRRGVRRATPRHTWPPGTGESIARPAVAVGLRAAALLRAPARGADGHGRGRRSPSRPVRRRARAAAAHGGIGGRPVR